MLVAPLYALVLAVAVTAPLFAPGYLLLRDAELIFCYDIRDKK